MDEREGKVLEEEETEELAHSDVRPASVHQQEALQVTELAESVVAGHGGLHALLPADSNADVCGWMSGGTGEGKSKDHQRASPTQTGGCFEPSLAGREGPFGGGAVLGLTFDHVDVVGSVANGQRDGLLVLLHQTHHVGLLLGGHAAADDRLALAGHVDEVHLWETFERVSLLRCLPVSPSLASPVSSLSPSRPWAGRPEGCWEAVAFPGGAGANGGVFSSSRTEFRS